MALAAGTIYELNASATANNVNGGGFNPTNANFLTDLTTDSNTANTDDPIVSSASYNFVAGDVGAWVYVKSGTNWTPGWYKISAVGSNKATLMAAIGEAVQVNSAQGYPTPKYKANTVAGCATVGTPTGGTFGIDYSQGTAAIINNTDLACADGDAAAPAITSAGSPFGLNHVGNIIHVTAGTGYTAGWYEIVSVSGSTATLDRAVGTDGAKTNGTFFVGGAMSLNSALDDDFFEIAIAGNRFFVKSGTYTIGEAIAISVSGGTQLPNVIEGYASLRGDSPTGSTRPLFSGGANTIVLGTNWDMYFCQLITSSASGLEAPVGGKLVDCSVVNNSTTAARPAFRYRNNVHIYRCEGVSYRGLGVTNIAGAGTGMISHCYLHDSDIGFSHTFNNGLVSFVNNIVACHVTDAVVMSASVSRVCFFNNTLYGAENTTSDGIMIGTGITHHSILNNIIYGFVTGITHADSANLIGISDYNAFYNNDTDVSNWQKGQNESAANPGFANVTQLTGTAATSSTNVLTVGSGTPFGSITDNVDYVHLVSGSGTGFAAGQYLITAHTTTTLTLSSNITSSGSGSSIVWQVTLGKNFAIGTNLKALGYPGLFPGGFTTGYMDPGAVQRQEAGGSSEHAHTFVGG